MKYRIDFLDFWHMGSGTGAGAALDATVLKDKEGFPYVPGRTLKGLLREMAEYLDASKALDYFGDEGDKCASIYVSNAQIAKEERAYLNAHPHLKKHLFDKLTSTRIDSKGVAEDKTLRRIEVVVPMRLEGEIVCEDAAFIRKCMAMVKQMGLNRNRGLGRCVIEEVKDAD